MSMRAVGLSFTLACAGGGAWAAVSLALGSQYAFIALGVGVLAGVGVMLASAEEHRRTQLGLAAGCVAALAIFASRFAVMYNQAGHADPDSVGLAAAYAPHQHVGVVERLRRINQAGGVPGDLGFYGIMWVFLGSLVSFKVATLGEPRHQPGEEDGSRVEVPLDEAGLLAPSFGVISMTPLDAPKDDGLPSLAPSEAAEAAPLPCVAPAQRRAA